MTQLGRARLSTAVCFLVHGAFLSSWTSRIPVIQHALHLSTAQLGLALLGAPVGQVLAMQLTPAVVHRWSSAVACRRAAAATAIGLVLLGLAPSLITLAAALLVFGLALGTLDIAMNTQAVVLERRYGRSIMSGLHGVYSSGVLAGSAFDAVAAALGVSPAAHFAVAAAVLAVGAATATPDLLGPDAERVTPASPRATPAHARLRGQPVLIAAGAIAFCALFAEGAVDNWSGVFLHRVRGASFGVAALGITMTGLGMALGRFRGDAVIGRWGQRRTLVAASLLAGSGLALTLVAGSAALALAGYAVFGVGVATIVPIAFTIAGNTPGAPPAWGLSRASAIGYAGQLSSPALIGLLARGTGLTAALIVPVVLLLGVLPLSRVPRGAAPSCSRRAISSRTSSRSGD